MAEHDDRVTRPEVAFLDRRRRPADVHAGDAREAVRAHERLACVGDHDLVPGRAGQRRHRRRVVDCPDQYERRRGAEDLQVDGQPAAQRLARLPVVAQRARAAFAERGQVAGDAVIEQLGAVQATEHAAIDDGELDAGLWAVDERRDPRRDRVPRSLERLGADRAGLPAQLVDEHLDRTAAHQPDLVRRFVADAVAQRPRRLVAGEDLQRIDHDVALHAAAGDRALDRPRGIDQHERPRRERRGALGVDQQGADDPPLVSQPAPADRELLIDDAHRTLLMLGWLARDQSERMR